MGVSGLLPALKASTQQVHIRDYRGKRVAVDSYVWLHRAVLTCAADLCMNVPTTKYVKYFMNRVQELLAAGIIPVLVFDGGKLPAKLAEEESREKRRAHALAVASNLMREGNRAAAADHFAKAVDITPQLAHAVQAAAALLGVEIMVAPYEADAQLAFLSRSGYVDAVISEDSDLLVYGCAEVLFKYDSGSGICDRILERDVAGCLGFPSHANEDFLKHVALLNGCDYCPGVNNVGIKKAVDLLRELGGDSVVAVNVLRAQGFWIDDKDVHLMKLGILTYRHQVVYNPATLRLQHLAPLSAAAACADTSFLGHVYDDSTAVAVASGRADPITKLPFHPLDEPCTCARHFALPHASSSDAALSGGAFKRPRMTLPSAPAPTSRVLPSVLSFFKAAPSSLPTPPPKSSHTAELELQAVLREAAAASPEPPVVHARSKYFATAAAGGEGEAAAVPFSARGGACGSLFKNINSRIGEAAVTEQPLVKKSSPRDGECNARMCVGITASCVRAVFTPRAAIERLKQYRYHKDENMNVTGRESPGTAFTAAAAAAA
jgi:exonuclease-1